MRVILPLLLALAPALAAAQSAGRLQMTAFGQSLGLTLPFDHAPAPDWQDGNADSLIAEWVPGGESVTQWTQMLTLIAFRGASGGPEAYDRGLALLRGNYDRGCTGAVEMSLGAEISLEGSLGARPVVLTCPQVAGAGFGEAMAALVIRGTQDLYTLQWAERFPVDGKGSARIPSDTWVTRLRHLGTARLCGASASC